MQRNYSNVSPPVALTADVTAGAVSLPVASTAGYPAVPFLVGIERGTANEEVCLCTDMTATTMTVTRGYDGTANIAHSTGDPVEHCVASIDYREANLHINDDTADDHSQYMRTDGTRHDIHARHAVGSVVPAGAAGDITASAPGDSPIGGASGLAADAGHRHARESAAYLMDLLIPAGVIWMDGGVVPPGRWAACDGSEVSGTTYPNLAARYGTGATSRYGAAAAGNVKLPDFRGRSPLGAGQGAGLSNRVLGTTGGEEIHVLTQAELAAHGHANAAHTHGVSDPQHKHTMDGDAGFRFVVTAGGSQQNGLTGVSSPGVTFSDIDPAYTGISINAAGVAISATGTDTGHNTMHPFTVCNFIVKLS